MGLKDLLKQGLEAVKDAADDVLDDVKTGIEEKVDFAKGVKADLTEGASKSECPICGGKMGTILTRGKLADGNYVCYKCWNEKVPRSVRSVHTKANLEQMKEIVAYCERHPQPTVAIMGFHATESFGDFYIDEEKQLFAFAEHKEELQLDTLVYPFSWIESFDVSFRTPTTDAYGMTVRGDTYLNIEYHSSLDLPELPFEVTVLPIIEEFELRHDVAVWGKSNILGTKVSYELPEREQKLREMLGRYCGKQG